MMLLVHPTPIIGAQTRDVVCLAIRPLPTALRPNVQKVIPGTRASADVNQAQLHPILNLQNPLITMADKTVAITVDKMVDKMVAITAGKMVVITAGKVVIMVGRVVGLMAGTMAEIMAGTGMAAITDEGFHS